MKLLFTYYVPSGGVETLNRERFHALKARGVECHFLYQTSGSGLHNRPPEMPVFIADDHHAIQSVLDTGQYDAVIVTSNYFMLERIQLCGFRKPVIFECQGLGTIEQAIGLLLEALPYVHTCCQAVLFPKTKHMRQLFDSIYPHIRQFSFHNVLHTNAFSYRPHPHQHKQDPIIGWVGRFEKNKNWRSFLRMAKRWAELEPNLTFWIYADHDLYEAGEKEAFLNFINANSLASRIVMHPPVPHREMADHYSQIGDSGGFLCSTSYTEGFGYALLEAMSCRCPVLSSNSDGPTSFIHHNITGKLYPVQNETKGIREGIELMHNHSLREKLRKRGQAYVRQHFSPAAYAEKFIQMLSELGVQV